MAALGALLDAIRSSAEDSTDANPTAIQINVAPSESESLGDAHSGVGKKIEARGVLVLLADLKKALHLRSC